MSVQATFSATLVDEWARLGVTDAVVCPGSRSTPLALPLADRLRIHVRLDERSAGFFALGLAMASGRPTVVCVTSGTAAAELHPAVVEAHHARVPLIVCTADRPPELHDTGAPQTIDQRGLYGSATRWTSLPGVATEGQEATWRPLAARAFAEATDGPSGPGPVHLNLEFREPLIGAATALPAGSGPVVVPCGGSGPASSTHAALEPLQGRGIIIAGRAGSQPPEFAGVLALADRLGWPVLADPLSGGRVEGTIAAADAIVRTEPPLPECVVLLGAPWLSRALGTYVADAARARCTGHRRGSMATVGRSVPGGDGVPPVPYRRLARGRRRNGEALRQAVARLLAFSRDPGAGGHRRGPRVGPERTTRCPRRPSLCRRDRRGSRGCGLHAHPRPRVVRRSRTRSRRGCSPTEGRTGSMASCRPRWAWRRRGRAPQRWRCSATWRSCTTSRGWSTCRRSRAPSSCSTTAGEGSSRSCRRRRSVEPAVFEQLFGTPPTSDIGAVARGFGLPVHDVTALSQLEPALAAPAPALVRVMVPGRPQNVAAARCDQPGGPSRAAMRVGEGVEVERRPVGLWKVSSTLASPEIFHPISCTQR